MASIRSRGNLATEEVLFDMFKANAIVGWRRNYSLFGKPDFVIPKKRIALFVDGCFWHHCRLHFKAPKTNRRFWNDKIQRNVHRDQLVNQRLKKAGWSVIRVWQHELRNTETRYRLSKKLLKHLR